MYEIYLPGHLNGVAQLLHYQVYVVAASTYVDFNITGKADGSRFRVYVSVHGHSRSRVVPLFQGLVWVSYWLNFCKWSQTD